MNAPRGTIQLLRALLCIALCSFHRAPANAAENVSFSNDIAPILVEKCLTCHGPEKTKGRYRVDSHESLLSPGASELAPIRPGDPYVSELFRRLITTDPDDRMPQDAEPLLAEEIEAFKRWIESGAKLDRGSPSTPLIDLVPRQPHPAPPAQLPNPVPVLALAFNSSGSELAVGGYHQVQIRALQGELRRVVTNVTQRVHALAFHPDGRSLIVVGGHPGRSGEAAIYDLETAQLRATPLRAPDELLGLAISPDGQTIAIAGSDNTIHLLDWESGKTTRRIQQHADWVTALDFSSDGKQLASASRDRTARVYELATGELITTYMEHSNPVSAVAFLDKELVISAGRDRSAHLWKIEDGKKQKEIGGFPSGVLGLLRAAEHLFILGGREIALHKAGDRSLIRKFTSEDSALFAMAFHAPSGLVAAGAYDGAVFLWSTENGELRARHAP